MINPFIFLPQKVTTVGQASYILSLYDRDIAASNEQTKAFEDNLNAIADVLRQTHPDLENDLDLLIENAKYVGHAEGSRQDLDTIRSQFRSALPYAIKKQL
jgi:hypothetical protein